jgi:hypothetical protein
VIHLVYLAPRRLGLGFLAAICVGLVACSGGSGGTGSLQPQSVIDGQVDTPSFASPPTAFAARDENGNLSSAPIGPAGSFRLGLPSGHVYRLFVASLAGSTLLVFPKSNRVDDAFALESDGAEVPLGTIRPLGGSAALPAAPATCRDGVSSEGTPCSIVTETASCSAGYASSPASCDDLALVLAYGTVAGATAGVPTGTTFAVSAIEPPCEVLGCDAPDPGNPPQGTVSD